MELQHRREERIFRQKQLNAGATVFTHVRPFGKHRKHPSAVGSVVRLRQGYKSNSVFGPECVLLGSRIVNRLDELTPYERENQVPEFRDSMHTRDWAQGDQLEVLLIGVKGSENAPRIDPPSGLSDAIAVQTDHGSDSSDEGRGCGIYLIYGVPQQRAGLIGYVGQTVNEIARRRAHLSGGDEMTWALVTTLVGKGATPTFKMLRRCSESQLDAEEKRWYVILENSGWTLWNRKRLFSSE